MMLELEEQVPLQLWKPPLQVNPHALPSQVAAALAGAEHAVHDVVPQLLVLLLEAQAPLHRCEPELQVKPHDVISAIDNQVIQSAEQAVTILNKRTDHIQLVISLDRLADGVMKRHTVRVP